MIGKFRRKIINNKVKLIIFNLKFGVTVTTQYLRVASIIESQWIYIYMIYKLILRLLFQRSNDYLFTLIFCI